MVPVGDGLKAVPYYHSIERALPGITIAWLAGVLLLLARMTGGWWHVRRLHRVALASPSSRWQTACRRLAYRLGLPAAAHVVESALVDVPTVVGNFLHLGSGGRAVRGPSTTDPVTRPAPD